MYFTSNEIQTKQLKKISMGKIEKIDLSIAEIEETTRNIKEIPKSGRRKEVNSILYKINEIENNKEEKVKEKDNIEYIK